jgi:formate-dependent nitrite reductase cytochrome c552 subunit
MLEPVRQSFRSGTSLVWTRANDLPDYVYFDHSIHINKGVGCKDCHGPVDHMPLMYAQNPMLMEWCLNCHREPEKYLRPREQVFNMRYEQPSFRTPVTFDGKIYTDQLELGGYLRTKYHLRSVQDITSCSTCHR